MTTTCRSGPVLQVRPSDSLALFLCLSLTRAFAQLLFQAQALTHFSGMAAAPQELSAALSEVLRDCNVHEAMRQALQQQELLTVEDFAYAFPTLSHLDSLFSNLEEEVKETLAITDAASSVHCARLRRALDRCHAKSALEGSAALPVQASQALSVAARILGRALAPKAPSQSRGSHEEQLPRGGPGSGYNAIYPPS